MTSPLFEARDLTKSFGRVQAVRGVSLSLPRGKSFGLVGESGSGKSTVARLALRLIEPTSGQISFDGQDLRALKGEALRSQRRHMQMIFQDPFGSLNPRMTVAEIVTEPQMVHGIGDTDSRARRAANLIEEVGLPRAALERFPHEFSGGQRQRIAIARAMATEPALIVADEPVSALDVSVQAQVLNLMRAMQTERNMAMLFIGHDLRVVRFMCEDIAVMYLGEIVESGPRDLIFDAPAHPYTKSLLSAIPGTGRKPGERRTTLVGEIPSANNVPSGCAFRTRCPMAHDRCAIEAPAMRDTGGGRRAACHLLDQEPVGASAP